MFKKTIDEMSYVAYMQFRDRYDYTDVAEEFTESLEGSYVAKDYSQEAKEAARAKYGRKA